MSVPKDEARKLLQRQNDAIASLRTKKNYPPEFEPWRQRTLRIVKRIFGEESDHAKQFSAITYGLSIVTDATPESRWQEAYEKGLMQAEYTLKSFIDELEEVESQEHEGSVRQAKDHIASTSNEQKEYDVVISFAGEDRQSGRALGEVPQVQSSSSFLRQVRESGAMG